MTRPSAAALQTPAQAFGDPRTTSLLVAAEAVLAYLHPRAPLRMSRVSLTEGGA